MLRLVLAGLLALAAISAAHAQESLAGTWNGVLDVGAAQLRLELRIEENEDGYSAVMVSVDQGGSAIPVSDFRVEYPQIDLHMAAAGARYTATHSDGVLSGVFAQGGAEFPLDMARGAVEAAASPSLPGEREAVIEAGVRLAGTLRTPDGDGPHPAILLLNGSGSQDRDVTIGEHRIFATLADALANAGIASLRLDDRGIGLSGLTPASGPRELGEDAAAALTWLRTQPDVDTRCTGIMGHSEGGMIAFLLPDTTRPDFIVTLAGMAGTLEETLLEQGEAMNRVMGADEATINATWERQLAMLEALRSSPPGEAQAAVEAAFIAHGIPAEAARQQAAFWGQRYVQEAAELNPAPALASYDGPVLAIFAENDLQVLAETNIPRLESAREGLPTTILTAPGTNHLFQASETGSPAEYLSAPHAMAPEALALIVNSTMSLMTQACTLND
ncbi:MAG: alpha/beta hydrolase family protein [Caulobacterales bacterium]|uniref:alpha/beta hydrolase family protein n=1 Tax=Glycocaulis sp. TaxID=1969725 RepID=UPI003FA12B0C